MYVSCVKKYHECTLITFDIYLTVFEKGLVKKSLNKIISYVGLVENQLEKLESENTQKTVSDGVMTG